MVNILIVDDNVNYAINLMNYINRNNKGIKVCEIAKNGKEALEVLNIKNDIEVILLDYKIPYYNGQQVLEKIIETDKYRDSVIIISGQPELAINFRDNDMVYSIIDKSIGIDKVIDKINKLLQYKELNKMNKIFRQKVINEILYLGYDISHKGTQYLVNAINYIAIRPEREYKSLKNDIYPKIAIDYSESVHNIKCRIDNATTLMYYNCEAEKLKKYFNFYIDTKPKVKTIITTILNKIS